MVKGSATEVLTRTKFSEALLLISQQDPEIAFVISEYGKPPLRFRKPGFASLVQIILEQQVSLASSKAVFKRLAETIPTLDPTQFLSLDSAELRVIGFSRQKTLYCRTLALAILNGDLNLKELERFEDTTARTRLTEINGIGPWTADIYLLTALRRQDIWPSADLALAIAIQKLRNLKNRPTILEMNRIGDTWRPWRAVAARVLWQFYVNS